jgi:hypothetical protein
MRAAPGGTVSRTAAPFIVGAGRSGTTLLRMMLDSHPELAIPPETHFIPLLDQIWNDSPQPRDAVIDALLGHQRWADFELDGEQFQARLETARASSLADILRTFYSAYAEQRGKARWGDKTPRYVMDMPGIAELLPEAHFIHVIRDGRDVALSVRPLWFGPDSLEEAASWWRERIDAGQRAGAELPYLEVRYESLVEDVRAQLERVCRFLGLEFSEVMLNSHTLAGARLSEEKDLVKQGLTAQRRREIHARVRVRPDSRGVGRWRTEMTPEERRRFEELAGDTLERLGYPVD